MTTKEQKDWQLLTRAGSLIISFVRAHPEIDGTKTLSAITEMERSFLEGKEFPIITNKVRAKKVRLCESCNSNPASEPHPCPFSEEINGDETKCTCCDSCTDQCAQDI